MKNYSVSFLNDLQELDKNLNNVSNTINDVKTEVRYLSIRLSDINTHSREMAEMLQQFNVSMEDTKQGIVEGQRIYQQHYQSWKHDTGKPSVTK